MAGPLSGIRVLDLSRVLAGPWCTQMLADLGAEVIKIERPDYGDDTRQWGPPWLKDKNGNDTSEAAYYLSTNRCKHSLTLDISKPEGRDLVLELASVSDIFIENFKTGGLSKKGLGYDDVKKVKEDIIYCSITGFGQDGPRARQAGYDYLIQAMGGLMSITGNADGEPGAGPQRVGVAVADLTTGMYSTIAIQAALYHRQQSGQGQHIDMSLLDTQVSWLANQASNYIVSGKCPERSGAQHPNLAPYQPFKTSDGFVILAIGNDGQFQRFCKEANRSDLSEDQRFQTNPLRNANRNELIPEMEKIMASRSSSGWITSLKEVDVPCGPINTIEDVFEDPQVQHRGMKIELEHPVNGKVSGVANPIKYSETPLHYSKAAPMLGEDTEQVLRHVIGKSKEEIEALRKGKII
ncbi:MAG: CoA transferase [Gammaproteobacteria bacterium]|nr:CoA transferase [Gammaproteobacteria bacterium]